MSNSIPDSAPKPRLSHVKKWSTFNGYGFNLHAEKGKAGQFIGKVDPGSPAESAGLKEGDRIIEVNGTNIGNENHSQVVQRIKAVPNETKLLVVDSVTDEYFKEQKVVIRGDMPYVEKIECSDEQGGEPIRSTGSEENVGESQEFPGEEQVFSDDISDSDEEEVREFLPADALSPDAPAPRQCHMRMWPDFQGYGFNLHAEKGKPGQFIGKVDEDSPADAAGLKQGDRIVEVNGQFIGEDNHSQVVSKIKSDPTRTTMLVVDEETEKYYNTRSMRVHNGMPNVQNIHCPASQAEFKAGSSPVANEVSETVEESPAQVTESAAPPVVTSAPAEETGPSPRLCHLKIWPDYNGYGFNLHAEKGKGGQYIGKVDEGSPAEAAGLRPGDKIVEVNGKNVGQESHKNVVAAIKEEGNQARLLVLDPEAFEYYKQRDIIVAGSMSNVQVNECPDVQPIANGSAGQTEAEVVNHTQAVSERVEEQQEVMKEEEVDVNENVKQEVNGMSEGDEAAAAIEASIREAEAEEAQKQKEENADELNDYEIVESTTTETKAEPEAKPDVVEETKPEPVPETKPEPVEENKPEPVPETKPEPVIEETKPEPVPESKPEPVVESKPAVVVANNAVNDVAPKVEEPSSPKGPVVVGGIEFAGSAKEARERLTKRSSRKHEVKKQDVSMRDKYELFQKL